MVHVLARISVKPEAAAADAHMTTPHVQVAIAAAGAMFSAPPEIATYSQLG